MGTVQSQSSENTGSDSPGQQSEGTPSSWSKALSNEQRGNAILIRQVEADVTWVQQGYFIGEINPLAPLIEQPPATWRVAGGWGTLLGP